MISLIMSLVAIVTITDRPSSVRNRCVIEVFDGVFLLSRCFLDFSVCRGLCHRAVSDLFLFLWHFVLYLSSQRTAVKMHIVSTNIKILRWFFIHCRFVLKLKHDKKSDVDDPTRLKTGSVTANPDVVGITSHCNGLTTDINICGIYMYNYIGVECNFISLDKNDPQ